MLPDFFFDFEGINGHCMNDEELVEGEYYSRPKRPKNDNYYHIRIFADDETYQIVCETEKAILFHVDEGQFWCPKALIRRLSSTPIVHKSFKRTYIS